MGAPSTWQEFLDTRGEGIHHIAFTVNDMDKSIQAFEARGIPMIQHGGWDTDEYGYFEGRNGLALIIELLENYE
jgi:4-hydroxyphenylpyruvate dioxygenase-like putative hemolysin